MLLPELEDKINNARQDVGKATAETIIEKCQDYLKLLGEYRTELYKFQRPAKFTMWPWNSSQAKGVENNSREVRLAIEQNVQERNKTVALLRSFTSVSAYEAVELFNQQRYNGHDDWILSAGGISLGSAANSEKMTIHEAVETASLLRRKAYIARNIPGLDTLGLMS